VDGATLAEAKVVQFFDMELDTTKRYGCLEEQEITEPFPLD
jgi:hypothetical protein